MAEVIASPSGTRNLEVMDNQVMSMLTAKWKMKIFLLDPIIDMSKVSYIPITLHWETLDI